MLKNKQYLYICMVLAASSLASCSSLKTISSNVQAKAQKITAKKPRPVEINKGNTELITL
jgi:predicted small secreted protein